MNNLIKINNTEIELRLSVETYGEVINITPEERIKTNNTDSFIRIDSQWFKLNPNIINPYEKLNNCRTEEDLLNMAFSFIE